MKTHISTLLVLAAVATTACLTACEDVPAPYEVNSGDVNEETVSDVLIDESFSTSLGDFSAINTTGSYSWAVSYSCAQVTSYTDTDGDGTKENNAAESWLISPTVDLSNFEAAHISFDYILRYANASELKDFYQLLISKDYTGLPAQATWTALEYNQVQGSDWDTWYNSGNVNVPEEFLGQSGVTVALRYKAEKKSATWEVKNFKMERGAGDYTPSSGDEKEETKTLPYEESFSTSLGSFKNYTTSGSGEWIIDYSTAKATGYDNTTKVTTAGTYYLVSPEISLSNVSEAHVTYEYILRYNKDDENQQLYITASFNEADPASGWVLLNGKHTEGADWSTFSKADIDIPADYIGKTIRLAFRYNTNATSGSTWEVKNFSIESGQASSGDNTGGDDNTGDDTATNGDFENWTNGQPNNWKTTSTAGNATLSQSTDAHGGTYSVEVTGASSNKRLGYKETTLPAGSYTMKFYAKAATSTGGSVRPGYVVVSNGAVQGSYIYGDYTNDLTTSAWTEVAHTFTLESETTLCLVIMNSKNPGGNVLIDDFTLTNAAGTALIK